MDSALRPGEVEHQVQGFGSPGALAWVGDHGGQVDSVELKALLLPPAGPAAESLTGRARPTWSVRQSYLLDTASLDLVRAGVEVRLRRRTRGRFDLAVSASHSGTARGLNPPRSVRVEVDLVPGGLWRDLEVRRDVEPRAAAQVIAGGRPPRELLSATQRSWACTGGHEVVDTARLSGLVVHGPLVVRRVKVSAPGLGRADLEHFRFPSGRELLELSTHCGPPDVADAVTAFERLLRERDVAIVHGYCTKSSVWQEEARHGRDRGPRPPG